MQTCHRWIKVQTRSAFVLLNEPIKEPSLNQRLAGDSAHQRSVVEFAEHMRRQVHVKTLGFQVGSAPTGSAKTERENVFALVKAPVKFLCRESWITRLYIVVLRQRVLVGLR